LLYNNTTSTYEDGKGFGTGIWGNNGVEDFAFGIGGYEVMLWEDKSGNNSDAKNAAGNYNTFANFIDENSTTTINYNPSIDFNGSANVFTLIPLDLDPDVTDPKDIYVVYKSDVVSGTSRTILGNDNGGFDTTVGPGAIAGTGANVTTHASVADVITKPVLLNTFLDDPTAGASVTNVDGASTGVFQYSSATGGEVTFQLGARGDTTQFFDGRIAETIIYNTNTSSTDRAKIQSYLAVKYGITINQSSPTDYVASNGTTFSFDKDIFGLLNTQTFNNDITVIGRDDLSGLAQIKSKSQNSDGIVTIEAEGEGSNSNATFVDIADYEFLAIANDDGAVGWTDSGGSNYDDAPNGYQVQNRTWQVQENNGDVGTVEISVDLNDTDFDIPNLTGSDLTLYFVRDVGDDANMSNEVPVAMYDDGTNGDDTANDNIWTISGVNLVTGIEFTFAQKTPVTPGGISDAMGFWYKADLGVYSDSTCNLPLSSFATSTGCWKDWSGNNLNALLSNGTGDPAYTPQSLNFNPAIMFDANDALRTTPVDNVPNSTISNGVGTVNNTMSAFAVFNSRNDNPVISHGAPSADIESISIESLNNTWENANVTKTVAVSGKYAIDGFVMDDNAATSYQFVRNGTTNGSSNTPTFVDAGTYEISIGSGNNLNSFFDGPATELIGFKQRLPLLIASVLKVTWL
jgi:hypothetical protein